MKHISIEAKGPKGDVLDAVRQRVAHFTEEHPTLATVLAALETSIGEAFANTGENAQLKVRVNLSVDLSSTEQIVDLPGVVVEPVLAPGESRAEFAARTGGRPSKAPVPPITSLASSDTIESAKERRPPRVVPVDTATDQTR